MSFYLVDFENVKSDGLKGIDKLEAEDSVVIFYSDNADRISFDIYNSLTASKAEIKLKKVTVGPKNALDFQLAAYLGYEAAKNSGEHYYIVSNDNGYGVLRNFLENVDVEIICSIQKGIDAGISRNDSTKPRPLSAACKTEEYEVIIKQRLVRTFVFEDEAVKSEIIKLINDTKKADRLMKYVSSNIDKLGSAEGKVNFNNWLCREYGSDMGGKVYRIIHSSYKKEAGTTREIREIISRESEIEWLAECINETHIKIEQNRRKSNIHNSIREKYGPLIGGEIYKAIRSVI